ncbi:MAG: 5-keto-4-deoxyuronate isomerase [Verrucomicrobia bacterium]|nr:5-keto-4-deoxyuronate isomerase [Verrucomicrobiota bacterium]
MNLPDNPQSLLAATLAPEELRQQFLVAGLFRPGEIHLRGWETDRTVLGGAVPLAAPLVLPNFPALRAAFFFERREAGIINLGGAGSVRVDGVDHPLGNLDALYVGRGVREVVFASSSAAAPARFYLLSYPAHAAYPTRRVGFADVAGISLGARENANQRTLFKIFHPAAFPTCQLVMGFTRLETGSVWNTMPPHTHLRRSEVYLYFDVPPAQAVFHFMGGPRSTRHLVVRDLEAVLSPPWSVHCGAGTAAYGFVWGMGGENQEFADMDPAPLADLL